VGTTSGLIRVWDMSRKDLIRCVQILFSTVLPTVYFFCSNLQGHSGAVTGVAVNSYSAQLVSGSLDGTARLWNLLTVEKLCVKFGNF
jgi:WD40 repeat protein